jgi:hypothetical protein
MSDPACVLRAEPAAEIAKPGYRFKLVFNARGIVVGPMSVQHTELRAPGVAFRGDAQGDAAAAVVYEKRIEIRAHPALPLEAALPALARLVKLPALAPLMGFEIVYGGRRVGRLGTP